MSNIILGNHIVEFGYSDESKTLRREDAVDSIVMQKVTRCSIKDADGVLLSEHKVRLHHKDQFNRGKGRHLAFKGAVKGVSHKVERTRIWYDYRRKINSCAKIVDEETDVPA